MDECADGTDNCDRNATCADTVGSFMCNCSQGYTGNGTFCSGMLLLFFLTTAYIYQKFFHVIHV